MKKNFKVRNFVAIIMVTAMATSVFAGCSTANDDRKESTVISVVEEESKESSVESEEASVEESEETSEVSVQESSEESEKVSKQESSEKASEVSLEESSEESKVVSEVESSVVSEEESEVESSVENSAIYTLTDIIRYGRPLQVIQPIVNGEPMNGLVTPSDYLCIVKINVDTYDIYMYGIYGTVNASDVELYPQDYIPDFSKEGPFFGLTMDELASLKNS